MLLTIRSQALTLALKTVPSCTDKDDYDAAQRYLNKLLNGGCQDVENSSPYCPNGFDDGQLSSLCQRVQADYVFEYLAFIFGVAIIGITFFLHRSGKGPSAAYV